MSLDFDEIATPLRPAQMVILLDSTGKTPTFHAWGDNQFAKAPMLSERYEERWSRHATRCGRTLNEDRWVEERSPYKSHRLYSMDRRWVGMRFDNASAIGKPCRSCYPAPPVLR